MLRYVLIPVLLLAACLAATPAYAGCSNPTGNEADRIYNYDYQTLQFCNGTNWVPFGAYQAYVGPGDIVSGATAWYGLRAYNNAVAATGTQKAINIRRASDNTTKDILIHKSGNLDIATAATFCASTTCYVTEAYDQTGNGYNALQGTAAWQPQFVFNCLNNFPCMASNGTSQYLQAGAVAVSQPITMSGVGMRTGNTSSTSFISGTQNGGLGIAFGASNTAGCSGGNGLVVSSSANDNAWHLISCTSISGTLASTLDVDGNLSSYTTALGSNPDRDIFSRGNNGVFYLTGDVVETGSWPVGFTSLNLSSMCHNQYAYWGTSTAC